MEKINYRDYKEKLRNKSKAYKLPEIKGIKFVLSPVFPFYISSRNASLCFIESEKGIFPVIFNPENNIYPVIFSPDIAFIGYDKEQIKELFPELSALYLEEVDRDLLKPLLEEKAFFKKSDKKEQILDWLIKFKKGALYNESNVLITSEDELKQKIINSSLPQQQEKKFVSLSDYSEKDLVKAILSKNKLVKAQLKFKK